MVTALIRELRIIERPSTRIKHVEWVIALDSSYRALVFDSIWLEENKSSFPLIDVWFIMTLHHRPFEILEMVSGNDMV